MKLFFIFLFLISSTTISANYSADIKKLVEAFGSFTEASFDLAVSLGILHPKVAAFVKLLTRASSLVMAGVETQIKPKSDEYLALRELHRMSTQKFRDVQRAVESGLHEQRLEMFYLDYLVNVVLSIDTIQLAFRSITDPDHRSRAVRDLFVRECNFGNTPNAALAYLNRVANMNCQIPNKFEEEKYVEIRDLLRGIEEIAQQHREYKMVKKNLLLNYGQSDSFDRDCMLIDLRQSLQAANISSPTSIVEAIKSAIGDRTEIQASTGGCLLDAIADANNWNRPIIYTAVNTIRLHTAQLAVIQGACINVSSEGDPILTAQLFGELNDNLSGIFSFLSKWLPKKLQLAWPGVSVSNAKDAINVDITHENFNGTANTTASLVMQAADVTGEQGFVHVVLITENTYNGTAWLYDAPSCELQISQCASIKNYRGVNIFIFRYPLGSGDRARRAQNWFKYEQKTIKRIIRQTFNYGSEDLASIFDKIQQNVKDIIGPKRFFNALFLHNRNFWSVDCTIQVGVSYISVGSVVPINFVEFYFSDPQPWFFNFRYRLYLIL